MALVTLIFYTNIHDIYYMYMYIYRHCTFIRPLNLIPVTCTYLLQPCDMINCYCYISSSEEL